MSILEAIILGIIQGLSEFLPISSSGHLVLFQQIFEIKEPTMTFDVVLHVGTLIPVLIVYRKELWELIKKPFQKMTFLLIVGTIPAVIFALLFDDVIEKSFGSVTFLAIGFIITGIMLLIADFVRHGDKTEKEMTFLDAALIGCAQAFAILPSVSRSGATIATSLTRKLSRETAARFSFMLSIPAIVGALVLQLKDFATGEAVFGDINFVNMAAGFVASMLAGYLAINIMLNLIRKTKMRYFAWYVFALAALILLDHFVFHIFL